MEPTDTKVISRHPGKWGDPAVPKSGWFCTQIKDFGVPAETCQMCEQQQIRYAHHMKHSGHPTLIVGCVCAGRMEGDPEGARAREVTLKKAHQERPEKPEEDSSWIKAADRILERDYLLSSRELEFIRNMRERFVHGLRFAKDRHTPTVRQSDWFASIYRRVIGL